MHTVAPGESPLDLRPGAIRQINDKTNAVCVINAQGGCGCGGVEGAGAPVEPLPNKILPPSFPPASLSFPPASPRNNPYIPCSSPHPVLSPVLFWCAGIIQMTNKVYGVKECAGLRKGGGGGRYMHHSNKASLK